MSMTQATEYAEFVPPALLSIWAQAAPLGFGLSGFLGDDDHHYGAHLSQARLQGTGRPTDYTLTPAPSIKNHRAGAAIDLGTGPVGNGPSWAGEWLEWVRAQCQSGAIDFLGEIIGDPDLILGPGTDEHVHLYATGPDWQWVPYTGTGHVAWCHLWVRRDRLNDTTLGIRIFSEWTKSGHIITEEGVPVADIQTIVRNMRFKVPGHTYTTLDQILPAFAKVIDTIGSPDWQDDLVDRVAEAVIAKLKSSPPL